MIKIFYKIKRLYRKLNFFKKLWYNYFAAWDIINPIVEFNFLLFKEFYEKGGLNIVDWNSDENHKLIKLEIDEIHNYITKVRPERIIQIDEILSVWSKHSKHWTEEINEKYVEWKCASTKQSDYYFDMYHNLERILEVEDEKYLTMIIEIRNYLWT